MRQILSECCLTNQMYHSLLTILLIFAGVVPFPLRATQVHMLSGSAEYNSEASLQEWAAHLKQAYGVQVTFSLGTDRAISVEGLDQLQQADVLVVFCRRWELVDEQASLVRDAIRSGIPVLAIRTASHAFQFFKEFDRDVLGGDYQGHGSAGEAMTVLPDGQNHLHPVLKGIDSWKRTGKVYRNPNLSADVHVLLRAQLPDRLEPLAWVRISGPHRVFYTSMGLPADFENPSFIALLDNALAWLADSSPDCQLPLPR